MKTCMNETVQFKPAFAFCCYLYLLLYLLSDFFSNLFLYVLVFACMYVCVWCQILLLLTAVSCHVGIGI